MKRSSASSHRNLVMDEEGIEAVGDFPWLELGSFMFL